MTIHFFIPIPARNAESTIEAAIKSVRDQSHSDWTLMVIDDASTDATFETAQKAAGRDSRITLIKNKTRRHCLRNVVEAVRRYAPHDSVVVRLDGDDKLSDKDALAAIAQEYENGADAVWTQHRVEPGGALGISREMDGPPLTCAWTMSHCRTFRKSLIYGIPQRLFIDPATNRWWTRTEDQILYRPILHLAKNPRFLNRVCYEYRAPDGNPKGGSPIQVTNAERMRELLKVEYSERQKILLVVNGPTAGADSRFHFGEKRAPVGILTLASILQATGHTVKILDRFAAPGPLKEVIHAIRDFKPGVVGVYCSSPCWADSRAILSEVRRVAPEIYLMAGGPHATLYPEAALSAGAHCVVQGEADFEITRLIRERPVGAVRLGRVASLDLTPPLDYRLLDLTRYGQTWPFSDASPVQVLSSSRGCPHWCAFCSTRDIYGREYYAQSPERTVTDLERLEKEFGMAGAYFREDNFAHDARRVRAICDGVKKLSLKIQWACEIRADRAQDAGLVKAMAGAGCVGFYIGAEAATDRMLLGVFHKGITSLQIQKAVKNAKANGIKTALSFIIGHPLEDAKEVTARKKMIETLKPEIVYECPFRAKGYDA